MTYATNATEQVTRLLGVIAADPNISKETKELTIGYVKFLEANRKNPRTISKRLFSLRVFYSTIGKASLSKLGKKGMIEAMAALEKKPLAATTKVDVKVSVKSLYKHAFGEDEFYPAEVRWIKTTLPDQKRMLPEDVLTEDDVQAIMNAITDVRDLAIVALLYDAGLRIGELLAMRVKDVDLSGDTAHVRVDGKTGPRQVPVFFAAPYIGAYMNLCKNRDPDSPLWLSRGNWSKTGKPIDYNAVVKMIKAAAAKAQIRKPVNPHSFRKASATRYAKSLSDQQLKSFYGWKPSSSMADVYVRIAGRQLDPAVAKANGIKVAEAEVTTKLKSRECPKCRYAGNGVAMLHCGRCGSALDVQTALKEEELQKMAVKSAVDPEYLAQLVDAAVEERLKRLKK